jgi:uncharacterized membrane protein
VAAEVRAVIGRGRVHKGKIVEAIEQAEMGTSGEIRVHLSHDPKETEILAHARACFEKLKMHETRERNAVLLYVNRKLRRFALYGDQGIHEKVGQEFWNSLARRISGHIRERDLTAGILHAVEEISRELQAHFPANSKSKNELPNEVTED